jgi:hypothetical protein
MDSKYNISMYWLNQMINYKLTNSIYVDVEIKLLA